ncbi:hypothetical protein O181_061219 [Austropuccinia psidii MF-1]|uniref:Uncharacterized protein n=1 Tax=Austropuccinia psidii MF-1 TaxID=1389203 RepID=A0A9Q3EHQ7_9BASI|nr:hypothetical protein [Austropuccinia psidii MF-1]
MQVPDCIQMQALKKLAMIIGEIVPHAAGVEGLFSMISAIKTKFRNPMQPTILKMLSQIKFQLVQSLKSHNKEETRSTKRMDRFSSSCEFDQMRGCDAFDSPGELEEFEEGVFGFENQPISRQDAFIDTLFYLSLWGMNTMGL